MKEQIDQLNKAKSLLSSVLGVAVHNMGQSVNVQEARGHIRQAINKLESEQKSQLRKGQNKGPSPYDHWKDILAGVPSAPVSPTVAQAPTMSLDKLNAMIQEEKDRLAELEKDSQDSNKNDNLLTG